MIKQASAKHRKTVCMHARHAMLFCLNALLCVHVGACIAMCACRGMQSKQCIEHRPARSRLSGLLQLRAHRRKSRAHVRCYNKLTAICRRMMSTAGERLSLENGAPSTSRRPLRRIFQSVPSARLRPTFLLLCCLAASRSLSFS